MVSGTIRIKHERNGYWMSRAVEDGTDKPRSERLKIESGLTEDQVLERVRPYVGTAVEFHGDAATFDLLTRSLGDVVRRA